MVDRVPRILVANHHTAALPPIEAELLARGFEVLRSSNLVATVAQLAADPPDLVVFQPLTNRIDSFEVQQVLSQGTERRAHTLMLIAQDAAALAPIAGKPGSGIDDFMCAPPDARELLLRIEFNLARRRDQQGLEKSVRLLEKESITDFKTGLHNDRFFFQRLREEVSRTRRHRQALALVLFDFDNFKAINDQFDHIFGDYVLLAFARKLRTVVREIDIAARLGGDEFGLLLPNTDLEEAALLASRLREIVAESKFEKDNRATRLTLSMGVDTIHGDLPVEPEDFLRRTDFALLEAKKRGKNRICLYPEVAPPPPPKPPPQERAQGA